MKGKYFKLKVLAIVSFCLITVGFTGSYKLFCEVQKRVDEEIEKKLTYTTKEILKTDKDIKYVDLIKYNGDNVEIKKSQDDYNHITVIYKDKYFDNAVVFDKKNENKIDVVTKTIKKEEFPRFNFIGKIIENSVMYNKFSSTFSNMDDIEDKTKIIIEVKKLTYGVYDRDLFFDRTIRNILNQFNEFTIKDVNDEIIEIPKIKLKKLNYSTTNIEKLLISGDKSSYEEEYDDLPEVNVDTKNVKDFVEVDLNSLTTDLNITGAKKVIIEGMPMSGEIVVKYKVNDEEKSFTINKSSKNKNSSRKTIYIDSEKIFRTAMDSSLVKSQLDKIVDLKEIK